MTRERWTYSVIIEFFGYAVTDREATIGRSVRVVRAAGSVRGLDTGSVRKGPHQADRQSTHADPKRDIHNRVEAF